MNKTNKDLPMNWKSTKLKEVATLSGRIGWKGLTAKEYTDSGPLFLSVHSLNYGDYVDFRDAFHISQARYDESPEIMLGLNDILICKDGAGIGKLGIIKELPGPSTINSSLLLIRAGELLYPKFLYYLLLSPYFQRIVQSRLEGATTPHLYQRDIKEFPVYFPPLPEQKRIVSILDEVFEGIGKASTNVERNLENSRELFESYLDKIFTQNNKDKKIKPLCEITEKITKGSSPKWQGVDYVDSPGVLFVTSENVGINEMIYKKTKFVEETFNKKDNKSILQKGDVLTNIVGASIGRTAIYDRYDLANINQAVCLLRCQKDKLLNKYLAYLLNSPFFRKILHDNEINNARANLSLGFFRSLEVPVPDIKEQKLLVEEMDVLAAKTKHLEETYQKKFAALEELKQSILQKAFTGELTAKTVDKIMEPA